MSAVVEVRHLVVRYENFDAVQDVSFDVAPGQQVTLLGPSGCGKSSILRAIAGLERPSGGSIRILEEVVFDYDRKVNVPPENRGTSMVFQNYAIWPHMSVFENVAYGLRVRRVDRMAVRTRTLEALDLVGLRSLADRQAPLLSGGQQQRVALARAFVFGPKVILFDEPLSNLDARLRAQMRVELRKLHEQLGITSIYVTHDQEEALAVSDVVILLAEGRIVEQGDPLSIYFRPATVTGAEFVGASNIVLGSVVNDSAADGTTTFATSAGVMVACRGRGDVPVPLALAIKPAHVVLTRDALNRVNCWESVIVERVFLGDGVQYTVDWQGIPLRVRRPSVEILEVGERPYVSVAPEHCVLVSTMGSGG